MCAAAWRRHGHFVKAFEWECYRRREDLSCGVETNIYFVCTMDDDGPWKVGIATNPESRLGSIQVGNPCEVALYAAAPATKALEQFIHHVLRRDRIKGEWFRPTGRTLALADVILSAAQCSADMIANECGPVDAGTTLSWLYGRAEDALLAHESAA